MNQIHSSEHALYRFFDEHDALLYIGLTVNLPTRLRDHQRGKAWWRAVARMTVQRYPTREAVVEAERLAIIAEKPLHNVQHNSSRGSSVTTGVSISAAAFMPEFDYEALLKTPHFLAMVKAISDAGNASYGILGDDEWDEMASHVWKAAAFADCCSNCGRHGVSAEGRLVFPYKATRTEHGIAMHYACPRCQHRWFCGYPDGPRVNWPDWS